MSKVGVRLKEWLVDQDMSLTELAPRLGVTRPSLSKVLNGRAELSVDMAIRIESNFPGLKARELLVAQLDEQLALGWERKRAADERKAARKR